jgi:hypothetical protein
MWIYISAYVCTVQAIKCYKRAHENNDREGIALNRLGKLYAEVMDDPKQVGSVYVCMYVCM